jgi:PAS domain S-box-containing protein
MSQVKRSPLLRYGGTVLAVAVAALLVALIPGLPTRAPFALFLASIIFISVYTGLGEALLATALSAVVAAYLFIPPAHTFRIGFEGLSRLASFMFLALLISFMIQRVKRAGMIARLREDQMSTTLLSIGDAVIVTDMQGRVTLMNPVAQALTGWTLEDARGKKLEEVFHIINEQTRLAAENPVARVLREGVVVGLANHTILLAKDGREIPIDDSGAPIKDSEGNSTGVVLVFRDISEQKKIDEKIRFQAHLLDVVEQAMIATDMKGRITYWNQFAEKLYGWKAEEVIGRDVLDITPTEESREQAVELITSMRDGESWAGDFLARRRDGTSFPIRANNSPIYDESGKQIGIVGSSEDISERKRAEAEKSRLAAEIEQQRGRLNNIIASVPGVVWEAWGEPDAATQHIDFVSDYVELMLGYTVEEWLATPNFWLNIVHEDDKEHAAHEAAEKFAGRGHGANRFRWVAKDGRVLWVEAQSVAILDEGGKPVGMRGITFDITERKLAEEERARLAAIVESTDDAIIGKTLEGMITSWNRGAQRMYGYSAAEVVGQPISIVIPPELSGELASILERLGRGESVEHLETVRVRKDGTRINVSVTISPTRNAEGQVTGASTIAHDITERKLVEEQQAEMLAREQAARQQAEVANRTKDEFLATLSHELRTPLTAMLGWTWMLRSKELEPETHNHALETIERNVRAQAQLIDDLLDVSRIITGKLRLEVRPAELVPVILAAIDTARPAAKAKGIELETTLDKTASRVLCDPARMQQVVWNLLSNAVKFTPRNGRVEVRLGRVESHVELSVTDTGPGIETDFLPFVFDRFRQADSSTTRMHGGLGLGLAIVRHLMELHGGTVSVESAGEGQGSTFTVSLPLMAISTETSGAGNGRALPEVEDNPTLECAPALDRLRVLVVDDEPDARDLLVATLRQCGAKVTAVASASEALDVLAHSEQDVIVSDIGMPLEDGYMLIRKVREFEQGRDSQIPAIALTAYASESARHEALEAGFQLHLAKPVEPSTLIEKIAGLVRQKQTQPQGTGE